jgi:hypothetical protein
MKISRRDFLSASGAAVASFLLFPKSKKAYAEQLPSKDISQGTKLILLGTMGVLVLLKAEPHIHRSFQ